MHKTVGEKKSDDLLLLQRFCSAYPVDIFLSHDAMGEEL